MKKLALLIPLTICLVATMAVASGTEEGGGAAMGAPVGEVIPQSTVDAAGDAVVFATPADYQAKTGLTIPPYTEAPMLAAMVAAGDLPPVEDRVSEDPLVLLPLSEVKQVGRYTEKFQMVDKGWIGIAHSNHAMGMSNPYNFSHAYPQVFKAATPSDDASVWTFELRRGMMWSDGQPFTTEDVRFWFEDDASNRELNPNVFENLVQKDGTSGRQNIIDEYTFQYVFDFPYLMGENIFDLMALSTYLPAHYLKQFHPKYNDDLDALVKESGFNTWTELFRNKEDRWEQKNNIDKPVLTPWRVIVPIPNKTVIFERNPYYWAVDVAGQQLPYFDTVQLETGVDLEVAKLKALNGETDWFSNEGVAMFPVAKEEEREGKIRVTRHGHSGTNGGLLEFNLTSDDPVLRPIFQNRDFRFGVSHAINREQIIKLEYYGLTTPQQSCWSETSPFYDANLCNTALEYDPDLANELLDKAGLSERDADGYRMRPDGKRLGINMVMAAGDHEAAAEIVVSNLKDVGLAINTRVLEWGALGQMRVNNELELVYDPYNWGTNEGIYYQAASLGIPYLRGFWAQKWTDWFTSNGERGEEPPAIIREAIDEYWKVKENLDWDVRAASMKRITEIAADNLWTIGIMTHPGYTIMYNAELQNVPTRFLAYHRTDISRPQVLFF